MNEDRKRIFALEAEVGRMRFVFNMLVDNLAQTSHVDPQCSACGQTVCLELTDTKCYVKGADCPCGLSE